MTTFLFKCFRLAMAIQILCLYLSLHAACLPSIEKDENVEAPHSVRRAVCGPAMHVFHLKYKKTDPHHPHQHPTQHHYKDANIYYDQSQQYPYQQDEMYFYEMPYEYRY